MCVDILKHGFNKSFIEIFSLTEQQNQRRLQAGPESLLWTQVMLENEIEKLDVLRKFLCQAEAAERRGKQEYAFSHVLHFASTVQEHFTIQRFFLQ